MTLEVARGKPNPYWMYLEEGGRGLPYLGGQRLCDRVSIEEKKGGGRPEKGGKEKERGQGGRKNIDILGGRN